MTAPDFALVVCAHADSPRYFNDDKFGRCCRCQTRIKFRPDIPKGPPKACIQCAIIIMEESK